MTDTSTEPKIEVTKKYIQVNWPDISDVDACAKWVMRHEDTWYIDDLISFFDRHQNEW